MIYLHEDKLRWTSAEIKDPDNDRVLSAVNSAVAKGMLGLIDHYHTGYHFMESVIILITANPTASIPVHVNDGITTFVVVPAVSDRSLMTKCAISAITLAILHSDLTTVTDRYMSDKDVSELVRLVFENKSSILELVNSCVAIAEQSSLIEKINKNNISNQSKSDDHDYEE